METTNPINTNHHKQEADRLLAKLQALQEVNLELSHTASLEDLYRQAIELGRSHLGFDRLGLLLYDETSNTMIGTFGTDDQEKSVTNATSNKSLMNHDTSIFLTGKEKIGFWEDVDLRDEGKVIGTGWSAMAVLWSGEKGIGWLAADNHLTHEPLSAYQ